MKSKEEVIKALEICAIEQGDCEGCPYEGGHYVAGCGGCTNALMRDAAELLKKAAEPLVIKRIPEDERDEQVY
jgi:hypothetical protein